MASKPATKLDKAPVVKQSVADLAKALFPLVVKRRGLPPVESEYRFHPVRKWRFDYAFPEQKVAVECEGGVWMRGGGRHNRGKGMVGDMQKYSEAAALGWRIIRATPQDLNSAQTMDWITRALEAA